MGLFGVTYLHGRMVGITSEEGTRGGSDSEDSHSAVWRSVSRQALYKATATTKLVCVTSYTVSNGRFMRLQDGLRSKWEVAYSIRLGGVKVTCCRDGALKPEGLHSRS